MVATSRPLRLENLEGRLTPASASPLQWQDGLAAQTPASPDVVFVDEYLLDQVPQAELAGRDVVTIHGNSDAISQISAALANRTNIGAIRLISHGEAGTLLLGNQVIDQRALAARSTEIASWSSSLAPGADLLLYGCSVASTEDGISFVDYLAKLTGADVAASANRTGAFGGDINLEFATGLITHSFGASQADWDISHLQLPTSILPNQRTGMGNTLSVGSSQQFPNLSAYAELNRDGTVAAWGDSAAGGSVPAVLASTGAVGFVRTVQLYSTERAFAALRSDGSVIVWGDTNYGADVPGTQAAAITSGVVALYSTKGGFAALKSDNSIAWWYGSSGLGLAANQGIQAAQAQNITGIYTTQGAFAALRANGTVDTFGDSGYGGTVTGVTMPANVTFITSNESSFAALSSLGAAIAWGNAATGGGASAESATKIYSNQRAFAYVLASGDVKNWGDPAYGGASTPTIKNVTDVVATERAFCAVNASGVIEAWGDVNYGGTTPGVSTGYSRIFSTGSAFAGFSGSGSNLTLVSVWGNSAAGGTSPGSLTGVAQVYSTASAFAVIKNVDADGNGVVQAWGNATDGANPPTSVTAAGSAVSQLYATTNQFTALKADRTLVSWGNGIPAAPSTTTATQVASPLVQRPWFISGQSALFQVGTPGTTFSIQARAIPYGVPTPASDDITYAIVSVNGNPSGTLPTGINFSFSTGLLSGTPASGTGGDYNIIFSATNAVGKTIDSNFVLTIAEPVGSITSAATETFTVFTTQSFNVTTTGGFPEANDFTITGGSLPSGLSINQTTGVISGTPASGTVGTYNFTINASNGVGSPATQAFTLIVQKATQNIAWAAPSAITYGTPLSNTQLSATATPPTGGSPVGAITYEKITPTPVTSIAVGTLLNAGTYTLKATVAATADYNENSTTVTFDVNKAQLTITAQPNTKTYDANVTSVTVPIVTGLQTGPSGPDSVTGLSQTYDDPNVGTGKTLTVATYTVNDGNGGNNYTVSTVVDNTGVINQAALVLTAVTDTKTYDANNSSSATPTVSGLQGSDTVTGLTQTFDNANAGTGKTLSVSTYTVNDGNGGKNYSVSTIDNNTGVINKAALTITAVTNTKTYDSTTSSAAVPTVSGLQGSDTVTGLTQTYDDPNVGTGKTLSVATYTVNDGNGGKNYDVSTFTNSTGVINQAALTITAQQNIKTYDTTVVSATLPVVSGLQGSDSVTDLSQVYDNPNAGTDKTLTVATYTVNDGNGGKNYSITTIENTTGIINQAALTITAQPNTKTYDNNTTSAAIPVVTGLLGSDTATNLSQTYDTPNAGTGKTLTVASYTINDNNGGNNYAVTTVEDKTGVINKADVNIVVTPYTVTYDGTAHTATGVVTGVGPVNQSDLDLSGTTHTNAGVYDDTWFFIDTTGNYNNASGNVTNTINKAQQTIDWSDPANIVYGTLLGTTQLNAVASGVPGGSAPGNLVYTPPIGTYLSAGSHVLSVVAEATENYLEASTSVTIVVDKADQTITWARPSAITYGTLLSSTQLNATVAGVSGGTAPGALTYNPVAGTLLDAGTQSLTVTAAATDNYNEATFSVLLQVNRAAQVITWATPSPITYGTLLDATQLNATVAGVQGGSATGAVTYNPVSGTLLDAGNQTLTVNVAGTSNYLPATASVQLVVNKADQTIAWSDPSAITYGTKLSGTQLNATVSGVSGGSAPGALTYTPGTGTILNAGTNTLTVVAAATNNYNEATKQVSIVVNKADQTITWSNPAAITYGTKLSGTQLNATVAGVSGGSAPGALTYNPVAGTMLDAGSQLLTVTAAATDNYNQATKTVTLQVNKADQVITWANPANVLNGTVLGSTQLNATVAGVAGGSPPGALTYTPPSGTVMNTNGPNTLTVVAAATSNYNQATKQVTLVVDQAPIFTSGNATTFTVGTTGNFPVTSIGYPAPTYSFSGTLPSGVTLNSTTGVLSGNPAALTGGIYSGVMSAVNGIQPDANQNFTLTVNEAPNITSANSTTFLEGVAGTTFQVTATGFPAPTFTIIAGSLPQGLSFNGTTGVISGTAAEGILGSYKVTVRASNVVTNATQVLTINVWRNVPTATGAQLTTPFNLGAGSYVVSLGNGSVLINNPNGTQQTFTPFPGFTRTLSTSLVDRNGDGTADSILVAVANNAQPAVLVLDAATGRVAYNFYAFDPAFFGGVTVAGGITKFQGKVTTVVMGAAGPGAEPSVSAFDAVTGQFRTAFYAFDPRYTGGVRVAMSGPDATGQSLVVASPAINSNIVTFTLDNPNRALSSFYAFNPPDLYVGTWVAAGDLDGDGVSELVVGAGPGTNGRPEVSVFDLRGNLLKNFLAFGQGFSGGVSVAVSDYNKDGKGDIFASSGAGAQATFNVFGYPALNLIDAVFLPTSSLLGTFVANNPSAGSSPINGGT